MTMRQDIFEYHNGERQVFADPLLLKDRLVMTATEMSCDLDDLLAKERMLDNTGGDNAVDYQGRKARVAIVEIVRRAFGMLPFDDTNGNGATAEQVFKAYREFRDFLAKKKMRPEPQPTTSQPTASTPPPLILPTTDTTLD